jgi:hypothetical protein
MRYYAIKKYMIALIQNPGISKFDAAKEAAKFVYKGKSPESDQRARSYAIRRWADEFVHDGVISTGAQGKHPKKFSILASREMKEKCLEWINARKPMERDMSSLKKMIDEDLPEGKGNFFFIIFEAGFKTSNPIFFRHIFGNDSKIQGRMGVFLQGKLKSYFL